MKIFIPINLLLLLISFQSFTQTPTINVWSTRISGPQGNGEVYAQAFPSKLEVDAFGNFISLGNYRSRISYPTSLVAGGFQVDYNNYLIKWNSNKQFLWGVNLGLNYFDIDSDSFGHIYAVGDVLSGFESNTNILIWKRGAQDGSSLGIIYIGPTSSNSHAYGVEISSSNEIFLSGTCNNCDVDPGPSEVIVNGKFIAVYDSDLNYVRHFGLPNVTPTFAVDASGEILLTGTFSGSVDFDPNPATSNNLSASFISPFIAKYTNTGSLIWAKQITSSGSDPYIGIKSISTDQNNNIILCGSLSLGADFDPGSGVLVLSGTSGSRDNFLAKYAPDGTLAFAFNIASNYPDLIESRLQLFDFERFKLS